MDTQETLDSGRAMVNDAMHDADEMLRQNPVPAVIGALAIGFVVGLLVRGGESKPASKLDQLQDQLEETQDHLRTLLTGLSKTAKKKYKKGSASVMDAVDHAVSAAKDVDVDDYIDPASKWFRKLWGKYAS